jgi:hypothetical protein
LNKITINKAKRRSGGSSKNLSHPLGVTWPGVGCISGAFGTVPCLHGGMVFMGCLGVHSLQAGTWSGGSGCSWVGLVFSHYRLVPGLVAGCSWASLNTGWYLAWRQGVPGLHSIQAGTWPGGRAFLGFTQYRLVPGLEAGRSWVGGGVGSCGAELPWDMKTSSNILNFPSPETTTRMRYLQIHNYLE